MDVLWRASEEPFSHMMLSLLRYSKATQYLVRPGTSTTIQNIFKQKQSIFTLIEIVRAIIDDWLLHINKNIQTLVVNMQKVFNENMVIVKPLREISCFIAMLTVENHELKLFSETLLITTMDSRVTPPLFYTFIDKVFALANINEQNLMLCVNDTGVRDGLEYDIRTKSFDNNWFSHLFPEYNHADFVKEQNQISKYNNTYKGIISIEQLIQEKRKEGYQVKGLQDSLKIPKYPNPSEQHNVRDKNVRKFQTSDKKNPISEWIENTKNRLKPEYVQKYGTGYSYCVRYHASTMDCREKVNAVCQFGSGRRKTVRSHQCLCGELHPMSVCNKIYK